METGVTPRRSCGLRRVTQILGAGLMAGCAVLPAQSEVQTETSQRLHHVVIVWLKESGDQRVRQRYIDASRQLSHLPGVLSYEAGAPAVMPQRRASKALDGSYDVAVASVFESQQAFAEFLKNPEYVHIAQELLRPLVEKYQVYDFVQP